MTIIIHIIEQLKMTPVDVKDNTYIDFEKEFNNKDPKFKVADRKNI